MISKIKSREGNINIGIVGRYVKYKDAYLSIIEALNHAGFAIGKYVTIKWIDSLDINNENVNDLLVDVNGVIVADSFGQSDFEGKILVAKYARENNLAYLGICTGMQVSVIEFARNVLGYKSAQTREVEESKGNKGENIPHDYVIDFFIPQKTKGTQKGGTKRVGAFLTILDKNSKIAKIYKNKEISERHNHKYEFLATNKRKFSKNGFVISGLNPDATLIDSIELKQNDFYIGVQFEPQFKSRPNRAHPLFIEFLKNTK
jgi:CTP synthase